MTDWARINELVPAEARELRAGAYLRGILTGSWRSDDEFERRAMSEGTDSVGGYAVPFSLSSRIIDLARRRAVVLGDDALTVPMTSETLDVTRVAADPTAAWHDENVAVNASDLTLERVRFTARTLIVGPVRASLELVMDAPDIENVLETSFAGVLAAELDRVALVGSGAAPEPLGVHGAIGIGTVSMGADGAALADYGTMIDA